MYKLSGGGDIGDPRKYSIVSASSHLTETQVPIAHWNLLRRENSLYLDVFNIMTTELLYAATFNAVMIVFYVTTSSTWAGIAQSVW